MSWLQKRLDDGPIITAQELYERFGFQYVVGVGIEGRNAIAGSVCVAVVILPVDFAAELRPVQKMRKDEYVEQSFRLRPFVAYESIGWGSVFTASTYGLTKAIELTVTNCLSFISEYNPVSLVLADNFMYEMLPYNLYVAQTVMMTARNANRHSDAVMVARIIAKSARSQHMERLHERYPEYGWEHNLGARTPEHVQAILQHGITEHHRDLSRIKQIAESTNLFAHPRSLL
jgi:ribonuclease HII